MLYTTGQVTKILNVSKPTLYKICKNKGIKPQRTTGGNYRFSDLDLKKILDSDEINLDIEQKFVKTVNDIWFMLKGLAEEIWGIEKGEKKLRRILEKHKDNIFILNMTKF